VEQVLRQKDIILVSFPFSDQSTEKRRPALVISSDKFNATSFDVIVCAITSNLDAVNSVLIKPDDWKDGVYSECCIKTASVLTLDKKMAMKKIGRLSGERFREAKQKLLEILA